MITGSGAHGVWSRLFGCCSVCLCLVLVPCAYGWVLVCTRNLDCRCMDLDSRISAGSSVGYETCTHQIAILIACCLALVTTFLTKRSTRFFLLLTGHHPSALQPNEGGRHSHPLPNHSDSCTAARNKFSAGIQPRKPFTEDQG